MSVAGAAAGPVPAVPGDAGATLEELAAAAARAPTRSMAHARCVHALVESGQRVEALAQLEAAAALPRGEPGDDEHLAFVAFGLGAHGIARALYEEVVAARPQDATALYNLASSERTVGRLAQAEVACDRALAADPSMAKAAYLRSQVRTQRPGANHVDDLKRRLSATNDLHAAVSLCYALGKEFDDLGDYDQAFLYFANGAALRRRALDYDVGSDLWKLQRIREVFDAARLRGAPPLAPASNGFILGLPRSGTTLVERVLTGNPRVATNEETDNLLKALVDGSDPAIQDVFLRFAAADPGLVQRSYARRAADPRGRQLVLEKLPFNYLYTGAIRLTMPDARVVLVTRAPADNCLAMYTTLFGSGYPFSYDLVELARYFVAWRELMAHWQQAIPDQLLRLRYEDFVDRPVEEGRRVSGHLGVEWSDSMVRIEDNAAASSTASAAQVRRPIYKTAAGRWRNYERHLAPLLGALQAAGVDPYQA